MTVGRIYTWYKHGSISGYPVLCWRTVLSRMQNASRSESGSGGGPGCIAVFTPGLSFLWQSYVFKGSRWTLGAANVCFYLFFLPSSLLQRREDRTWLTSHPLQGVFHISFICISPGTESFSHHPQTSGTQELGWWSCVEALCVINEYPFCTNSTWSFKRALWNTQKTSGLR